MGNKNSGQYRNANGVNGGVNSLPYPENLLQNGHYIQRPRSRLSVAGYEHCNGGNTTRSNDWIYGSFGAQYAENVNGTNKAQRGQQGQGTNDSGYLTSGGGQGSNRGAPAPVPRHLQRGSRLSLNEAVFDNQPHPQPMGMGPGPLMGPPGPFPMDPAMGPPPFGMMQPFGPPVDPKEAKKWKKKYKKMAKKGSLPKNHPNGVMFLGPPPMGMIGPPPPAFLPHPHPMGAMMTCSMDDLTSGGVNAMPHPESSGKPKGAKKKFSSTIDLHQQQEQTQQKNPQWIAPEFALAGAKKRQNKLAQNDNSQNRNEHSDSTKFHEERPPIENEERNGSVKRGQGQLIYESINKRPTEASISYQGSTSAVISTHAEINPISVTNNGTDDSSSCGGDVENLPVKISAEARAILERNEKLFGSEPRQDSAVENDNRKNSTAHARPPQSNALPCGEAGSEPTNTNTECNFSADDECDFESVSEKEIVPNVLRRNASGGKATRETGAGKNVDSFDGNGAWQCVDVQMEVQRRLAENGPILPEVLEQRVNVQLARAITRQTGANAAQNGDGVQNGAGGEEPIYMGYDEHLPEFKKRLIESGKFQIETRNPLQGEVERVGGWEKENETSKPNDTQIQTKSDSTKCANRTNGEQNFASQQAGDTSDIDFSWVHDLESRMRAKPHGNDKQNNNLSAGKDREKSGDGRHNINNTLHLMRHGPNSLNERPPLQIHDNGVISSSGNMEQTALPTKYFGMIEQPVNAPASMHPTAMGTVPNNQYQNHADSMSLVSHTPSYAHLCTNVRAKAAMFESEARRRITVDGQVEQGGDAGRAVGAHQGHMHAQRPVQPQVVGNAPYIPMPDYVAENGMNGYSNGYVRSTAYGTNLPDDMNIPNNAPKYTYTSDEGGCSPNSSSATTSNSSGARLTHNHPSTQQHPVGMAPAPYLGAGRPHDRLAVAYNVAPNGAPLARGRNAPVVGTNQRLQAQRRYDSTEFYRRNMLSQQQRPGASLSPAKVVSSSNGDIATAAPIWQKMAPTPVVYGVQNGVRM